MLAAALERAKAGEKILVLGFGQGADALLLEATGAAGQAAPAGGLTAALARSRKEENYLKYLAFAGHLNLELGKRAEFDQTPVLTALYRTRKAVIGLVRSERRRVGKRRVRTCRSRGRATRKKKKKK